MSDKKLTAEELENIAKDCGRLIDPPVSQMLDHINAIEQELAQCQRELEEVRNIEVISLRIAVDVANRKTDQLQRQNEEMREALLAHLKVNPRGGLPPSRFDEALSWVENDRIVTEMVNKALANNPAQ